MTWARTKQGHRLDASAWKSDSSIVNWFMEAYRVQAASSVAILLSAGRVVIDLPG